MANPGKSQARVYGARGQLQRVNLLSAERHRGTSGLLFLRQNYGCALGLLLLTLFATYDKDSINLHNLVGLYRTRLWKV